jgi:hypothetical protein
VLAPACPSSWKSGKLSSDWFSHQKQVRESVGITADEDAKKPVVTPEGLVQCCAAFCDEVPQEQAHALNCGHAFCDESVTTRARRPGGCGRSVCMLRALATPSGS